jgi:translation initiation factor 1 (eIF-1/SUI1)
LPVRVERRGKGKKVTVVFNVAGDLRLLLTQLKQAAGSGGVVRDDTVEIQGEKVEFVEKFIKNKMKK